MPCSYDSIVCESIYATRSRERTSYRRHRWPGRATAHLLRDPVRRRQLSGGRKSRPGRTWSRHEPGSWWT